MPPKPMLGSLNINGGPTLPNIKLPSLPPLPTLPNK